ncbi:MAG: DEAD/DEAH box helicase, partial [Pseudomonadota bacterium]
MAGPCPLKGTLLTTFDALGLSPRVLKALTERGFDTPTPIQEQAIPVVLDDRDIMGLAQTGTGKTAAFGLPLIHKMLGFGVKPEPKTVRALILAPTRELAKQISDELKLLVQKTPLKIALVVGGASLNAQANRLQRGTDILVATPGRLIDLMDRRALTLTKTGFLVLDEADQMLDMGFIPALRKIAALLPEARQTLLFSATMPKQMAELSATYLTDPVRIEVSPVGRAADKIAQTVHFVDQKAKTTLLKDLLAEHRAERALVFCRT